MSNKLVKEFSKFYKNKLLKEEDIELIINSFVNFTIKNLENGESVRWLGLGKFDFNEKKVPHYLNNLEKKLNKGTLKKDRFDYINNKLDKYVKRK